MGARSHLLGEYHGNRQHGPQLSGLSFLIRPIKSGRPGSFSFFVFFLYYVASLALPLVHSSASPFLSPCDMVLVCPGGCEKIAEGECLWENVARQPKQHVTGRASLYGLGQKRGTSWDGLSELRSCCWTVRLQQIKQSCASEAFVVCALKTELNLCLNSQSLFTACFIANFSRS